VLNAAAALVAAALVKDLSEGVPAAQASIDEGRADAVLDALIRVSRSTAGD
jgi:anthranilate phosphoribosyltransferase